MTDPDTMAATRLRILREGSVMYENLIALILQDLKDRDLTLEDIGTSAAEIEELRVKGCRLTATTWLYHLRKGISIEDIHKKVERRIFGANADAKPASCSGGTVEQDIGCLCRELIMGGLTPEDIGTSVTEIASFKKGNNSDDHP